MPPGLQRTTPASVARAEAIAAAHRRRLVAAGIPGELLLIGGSSLVGLLTKGDVDLHLRVPEAAFPLAVERLTRLCDVVHPGIWTDDLATFEEAGDPPVGIAVTVAGGEHDRRFTRGWARLRADAGARERYDALKRGGGDVEARKSAFFDEEEEPPAAPPRGGSAGRG